MLNKIETNINHVNQEKYILLFIRLALGFSFLSAVADRFGLWGITGETNIAWGNIKAFEDYVLYLNPYLSNFFVPVVSWSVTIVEIILGMLLIVGIKIKETALISAILLLIFAVSMSLIMGIKAPLDYSVFTALGSAFLLYLYIKKTKKEKYV